MTDSTLALRSPLHEACWKTDSKLALALLAEGADIHALDDEERTPLHLACEFNLFDLVMALLDKGADVDARNEDLESPLHSACYSKM